MNIFNDAIDTHAEWKLRLKKQVEAGLRIVDAKDVANSQVCELGQWIYGQGLRYNGLPSFEALCFAHEQFHRAAAELVQDNNAGEREKALAMLKDDGICERSSSKLVRALMECSKELSSEVVNGVQNAGRVRDLLAHKEIPELYSIQSSQSVYDGLKRMVERNIGALVVYRGKEFLGLFTERGFTQNVVLKGLTSLESPISTMIDGETFGVDPEDSIEQCMTLMTATHKRHLPVFQDGKLIGLISIGDVVKQASSEDHDKRAQLEGYIYGRYGAMDE